MRASAWSGGSKWHSHPQPGCNLLPAAQPQLARPRAIASNATKISYAAVWNTEPGRMEQGERVAGGRTGSNLLPLPDTGMKPVPVGHASSPQLLDTRQPGGMMGRGSFHPRALTALITSCRSWQDLQTILQEHAQQMNTVHLSALVTRLAWVSPTYVPGVSMEATLDSFLQDVSTLVSRDLDKLDPRGLANILWAVAKLGFRPSYTLVQRYLFAAYLQLPHMQAQELANLGWAAATMQLKPGPAWLQQYCLQAAHRAPAMKAQELANLTWAISRLLPASTLSMSIDLALPDLIHSLQEAAMQQQPYFKVSELMMMLMALHKLQLSAPCTTSTTSQRGYTRLLLAALPRLCSQMQWLGHQDVCNLVCLVAWDQQRPAVSSMWSLGGARSAVQQLCRQVEQDSGRRCMSFCTQALTRLVWGLASLGAQPGAAWQASCWQAVHAATQQAAAQPPARAPTSSWDAASIVTLLWGLARLSSSGKNLVQQAGDASAGGAGVAAGTDASGSAHTAVSAASLQSSSQPPAEQVHEVMEAGLQQVISTHLPRLTTCQLAQLTWSLGRLGNAVPPELGAALKTTLQAHVALAAGRPGGLDQHQLTDYSSSYASGLRLSVARACMLLSGIASMHLPVKRGTVSGILRMALSSRQSEPGSEPVLGTDTWASQQPDDDPVMLLRLLTLSLHVSRKQQQPGGAAGPGQAGQTPVYHACRPLIRSLIDRLAMHAHQLHPMHVYKLLCRLSAARVVPSPAALQLLVRQLAPSLRWMPAGLLSRALVVLAQLGFRPNSAWADSCLHLLHARMNSCNLRDVSCVLWSLAKWHVVPSLEWLHRCIGRLCRLTRNQHPATASVNCTTAAVRTLWALHKLHAKAPGLKTRLTQMALAGVGVLSASEAVWLLFTLTTSQQLLLRSQWRRVVKHVSRSYAASTAHRQQASRRAKQAGEGSSASKVASKVADVGLVARYVLQKQGLTRRQVYLVKLCMSRGQMRWSRRWPAWLKAQVLLQKVAHPGAQPLH